MIFKVPSKPNHSTIQICICLFIWSFTACMNMWYKINSPYQRKEYFGYIWHYICHPAATGLEVRLLALLQPLRRNVASTMGTQAGGAGHRCLVKLCDVGRLHKALLSSITSRGRDQHHSKSLPTFLSQRIIYFLDRMKNHSLEHLASHLASACTGRSSNSSGSQQWLQGGTSTTPVCSPSHTPCGSKAEK